MNNIKGLMITNSILLLTFASGLVFSAPISPLNMKPVKNTYVEGLVGYNRYAIADAARYRSASSIEWKNGTGNWALGANLGYQFQRYFSAEIGGIYTFSAKNSYTSNSSGDRYTNLSARPWYAYLAGKLSIAMSKNISIFTKLGLGYQRLVIGSHHLGSSAGNWGAMFGAGLAYEFTSAFYMSGQWLRFTGKVVPQGVDTTASNIFLLGIGCKFFI